MDDLFVDILLAKKNDMEAVFKIINRFDRFIEHQMTICNIVDKSTCYDEVVTKIMEGIINFKIF